MMTLADAILSENLSNVEQTLSMTANINDIDEYGFTPLIEAAIVDRVDIAALLLNYGARVTLEDMTGATALHWAAENSNTQLAQLLLQYRADPNAYNLAGQPVLVMPLLRQKAAIKKLLVDHGAKLEFAQDFINTKLLGHMFELVGTANIIDPYHRYVEIDFEGFFLEVTLGLIADSLGQYKNHFAARHARRQSGIAQVMVDVINRAATLIKYQQYRVNTAQYQQEIDRLILQEPLLIPVGYEGHAITFIKFGSLMVKCDRREDSRLYDNIVIYQITQPQNYTAQFVRYMMYEKQSHEFINREINEILGLTPITELKIAAQVSGNCSWANVEACIPTLHFLLSSHQPDFVDNIAHYKSQALHYFRQWRDWGRNRGLRTLIQSMRGVDSVRRVCKAEILAAVLYQCCNSTEITNREHIEIILEVLLQPEFEYILKNYVRSYCYEDASEEGRTFLRMLKDYGYNPRM